MKCKMGFCKVELSLDNTSTHRSIMCNNCVSLLKNVTKPCGKGFQAYTTWVTTSVSRIKSRAKIKGRDFNLTSNDIYEIWPENNSCPVLKIEFVSGGDRTNSPSIDRIDSDKGYVKGNIQILSKLANTMKSNATNDQLQRFAEYYIKK